MKFKKQDLLVCIDGVSGVLSLVDDRITGKSRWCDIHTMIFKHGERFYQTDYRTGSTECQDELPFEYAGDEIECYEVRPVERVVIQYERI